MIQLHIYTSAIRLGIRGTHLKSSIQDIVDEVAPINKAPLWGWGPIHSNVTSLDWFGAFDSISGIKLPKIAIYMIPTFFPSARMILLECRESLACNLGGALHWTCTSIRECTGGVLIWTLPYYVCIWYTCCNLYLRTYMEGL